MKEKGINMEKKGKFWLILRNILLTILFLGIIGLFGWYYYISENKIDEMELEYQRLEEELSEVKSGFEDEVIHTLAFHDSVYLSLLMKPFSWAVRDELLTNNYHKINQYLAQFVKEPNVKVAMVIDEKGIIVASSDMKAMKLPFADFYPQINLDKEGIDIKMARTQIFIVKPVMGFERRVGTIFVIYEPGETKISPGL